MRFVFIFFLTVLLVLPVHTIMDPSFTTTDGSSTRARTSDAVLDGADADYEWTMHVPGCVAMDAMRSLPSGVVVIAGDSRCAFGKPGSTVDSTKGEITVTGVDSGTGDILWSTPIGSSSSIVITGLAALTAQNGVICTGYSRTNILGHSHSTRGSDFLVVELNISDGTVVHSSLTSSTGYKRSFDAHKDVAVDETEGFMYIASTTSGNLPDYGLAISTETNHPLIWKMRLTDWSVEWYVGEWRRFFKNKPLRGTIQ
jgi:hypothetical protein